MIAPGVGSVAHWIELRVHAEIRERRARAEQVLAARQVSVEDRQLPLVRAFDQVLGLRRGTDELQPWNHAPLDHRHGALQVDVRHHATR
ncbi:MAG: hypothetical protein ACHQ4J_04840 [Candidatus Binatia bacterium]